MGEERERRGPKFEPKKMNFTNRQTKGKRLNNVPPLLTPTSHKKPIKNEKGWKI
jgi:hypothetical protein